MKVRKSMICLLLIPVLLCGCTDSKTYSYSDADKEIRQLQSKIASDDKLTKETYFAIARIFRIISNGEPVEADQFANLTRELIKDAVKFKNEEVFTLAADFEKAYTDLGDGKTPGIQTLKLRKNREAKVEIRIDYLGELLYSVEMVKIGDGWYGENEYSKVLYNGALGEYLLAIRIGDTRPSDEFVKTYPCNEIHKLGTVSDGSIFSKVKHDIKLKWINTDVSSYVIYIGSDMPFSVEEQRATKVNWPIGAVSIKLI